MSYESLTRDVHAILSFYNEKSELVDISRAVTSITVKQITCSEDRLKMGEFCKNCLEFEYYQEFVDEYIAWNNKRVKLSFTEGKTEEEREQNKVDVGVFYVTSKNVETSNNGLSYKITAYDLPDILSETFDSSKTSTKVSDIVSYICGLGGVSFTEGTTFSLSNISETLEEGISNIGMLAYIAGYDGKNIRTNGNGELETYWYYSNSDEEHFKGTISRDVQLLNEFTNAPVVSPLSAITSGYTVGDEESSTVISVGDGIALTYTNPYITKTQLENVLTRVKGFDYCVGSVKFRGNPNFRCGDTVRVETSQNEYVLFPILEQTITYDGGMNATVTSYSYETENTVMGSMTTTEKKIQQAYSGLTAAFQKQTGIINTNLKGGYYRLLQDEKTKYPYGWMITDSEEITDTTKGWRWTQGGLQYSENGFKTSSKIAITMDGAISADMITTGTLKAINIEGTTIKGSTISGTTISGGTVSGTTISGSTVKFGTSKTMTMSGDASNLYMQGNANYFLKTVGRFSLSNYKDTAYSQYQNAIFTDASTLGLCLQNFSKSTNNVANYITLWEETVDSQVYNTIRIKNNIYNTETSSNNLVLMANSAKQEIRFFNLTPSTNNYANVFFLDRTDSKVWSELKNYELNSSTLANNLYMYCDSSGNKGIGLWQRKNGTVYGNINISNNEAQIGSGDNCYLHFNTDGYLYGKFNGVGAYKLGFVAINGHWVIGTL